MEVVILVLALLMMVGALLAGIAALPLVLIVFVTFAAGVLLIRLIRNRRLRPR